MDSNMPFSQAKLNEIFKVSSNQVDRVISRECSWLEFKKSFGWASIPEYLRSCAAFANTKGGYIVFGIDNRPHILRGLKGKNLEAFNCLDPEVMTNNFNDHFAPEIEWGIHQYELHGNIYGLLYVHESKNKPVVCCKNAGKELKEGDIYYRYRGRTQRIKYPELRAILDAQRKQEQRLWMRHLANIARIGVREAGIFDLYTGKVTGSGGSFLIDESLLSQLSFIKEGEFSEVKGKPTLKLIGNVEPIGSTPYFGGRKQIVKTKGIRTGDIVLSFLNHSSVEEPLEFIKQICFESTAFLPVYYYIHKAGLGNDKIVEILNGIISRSQAKKKIIERLTNNSTQQLSLSKGDNVTSRKKREFAKQLVSKSVDQKITGKNLEHCLQAVRCLSLAEVSKHSVYLP